MRIMVVILAALVCRTEDRLSAQETWFDALPLHAKQQIIWKADHESGSLKDWVRESEDLSGSGVFNTGGRDAAASASRRVAHSGSWSVETRIENAYRAQNGNRAVRLMIWTNKPWNQGGEHLPQTAYYSTWMYFPHLYAPEKQPPWDPGDGGWWNVFQFKSEDAAGQSQPVWSLNVASREGRGMSFYLYSDVNDPHSYEQDEPAFFQDRQWVHVEALYRSDVNQRGRITIFQDGRQILDADAVTTSLGGSSGRDAHAIWGIGNYTDHVSGDPRGEGTATIYFDDSAVSLAPLSRFVGRESP